MTERAANRRLMRILAVALTALWAAVALAVASVYRPGGAADVIVALACLPPVLVAAAGIVVPPTPRDQRGRVALAWIWIAAVLFAIPVIYNVAVDLIDDGPRSLLPSFEAVYAGGIALYAMCFFSLVGWVHRRRRTEVLERRSSWAAGGLALLTTFALGLAFVLVAIANERALRDDEPALSRFGPTDPELVPPFCDEPLRLGRDAVIEIVASSSVDGTVRGTAVLRGARGGRDEAWGGSWSDTEGVGRRAYRRVGRQAWVNAQSDDPGAPGTTWLELGPNPFGLAGDGGLTMDGPPHAIVDVPRGELVPEDLGLVLVDGARARHCRTFIDGPTALDTFLPLRWLLVGQSVVPEGSIPRWRGELDWWVFGDGELGMARAQVSGPPAATRWPDEGVQAVLEARLEATDRGIGVDVSAPGSGVVAPATTADGSPGPALGSESA